MTSWLSTFSEKCSISFNNEVISDENIINRYLSFLTGAIDRPEHTVGLAMHTGSICFDAISVLAAGIESLSYCRATTDDILNGFHIAIDNMSIVRLQKEPIFLLFSHNNKIVAKAWDCKIPYIIDGHSAHLSQDFST